MRKINFIIIVFLIPIILINCRINRSKYIDIDYEYFIFKSNINNKFRNIKVYDSTSKDIQIYKEEDQYQVVCTLFFNDIINSYNNENWILLCNEIYNECLLCRELINSDIDYVFSIKILGNNKILLWIDDFGTVRYDIFNVYPELEYR